MRRPLLLAHVALLLTVAAGCGDTPSIIFREGSALRNEVADTMLRIHDEESAQELYEGKFERIKKKWEELKHRAEKIFKDAKEEQKALIGQGFLDSIDEAWESNLRVMEQGGRIYALRYRRWLEECEAKGNYKTDPVRVPLPPHKVYPAMPGEYIPQLKQWQNALESVQMKDLWSENPFLPEETLPQPGRGGGAAAGAMP